MLEAEIKRALCDYLSTRKGSAGHFLEEVEIIGGRYRADLVDPFEMHCFEIKSDRDSLKRLFGQGSAYSRVFSKITLVLSPRHLNKALSMIPDWWGVLIISDSSQRPFELFRHAKANKHIQAYYLSTLLNKEECLATLQERGQQRGWKSKSLYELQEHLAETLRVSILKQTVRSSLQKRAVGELAESSFVQSTGGLAELV